MTSASGVIHHRDNQTRGVRAARFCLLDFIDDAEVAQRLLETAEDWALERGMSLLEGPVGLVTFERSAVLIEGFDHLPTAVSSYNFPYYGGHIESSGSTKEIDYLEHRFRVPRELDEKYTKVARYVLKRKRLRLLQNQSRRELLGLSQEIFRLVNDAYSGLFEFAPMSRGEINALIKRFAAVIDPRFLKLIVDKDGVLVGVGIAMPSLSPLLQGLRGKLWRIALVWPRRLVGRANTLDLRRNLSEECARPMRIVTGCSRSGTSFVCQAVHHLGGDFGAAEELIEGDQWNQRGYFENRAVNTLNHRLLFGRWSDPKLWIDIMWPSSPWIRLRKLSTIARGPVISHPSLIRRRGRKLRSEIAELGRSLEGKMVKDPRFSYLMEPWTAAADIRSVLYVLRHPREAAMSMSRQTKLPLKLTYLGWVDAIEKFWKSPPEVPVHIVDYNAFFDPAARDREMRTLCEFLGRPHRRELTEEVLDKVLDSRLRTQRHTTIELPPKVAELYAEILERKTQQHREIGG